MPFAPTGAATGQDVTRLPGSPQRPSQPCLQHADSPLCPALPSFRHPRRQQLPETPHGQPPRSPVPGPLRSLARGGPWRPVSPEPCPSAGPGPLPAVPQSHPQLCQWTACPVPLLMSACVLTQESLVYDCGVGLGFLAGLSSAWHAAWLVGIRSTSPLVCCRMLPGRHETARAQPARPGPWRACRPPVWLCCGDAFSGTFVLFF